MVYFPFYSGTTLLRAVTDGLLHLIRFRNSDCISLSIIRRIIPNEYLKEAGKADNEMFDEGRLTEALNLNPDAEPGKLPDNIRKAEDTFAQDAPQFDVLIMLSIKYHGIPSKSGNNNTEQKEADMMDQITVNATIDQVRTVTNFVNGHLETLGCSERVRVQVDIAIDEIFSNIAHYAYSPETGSVTVRAEIEEDPLCVIITFIDHGKPFDPLAKEQPDTTKLPKAERPIGGLGLFVVKKTMDDISYSYEDGRNILTIRKKV